jgi:MFS superfamily sulfate permease-like transporter
VATLVTSSMFLNVDATGATSSATRDSLSGLSATEDLEYLVVLGLLVGASMLLFALLRLGFLVILLSRTRLKRCSFGIDLAVAMVLALLPAFGFLGSFEDNEDSYP